MLEAGSEVIGRAAEQTSLEAFAEGVRDGPAGLLLEGAAGMGKTTLWRFGVEIARARGYRVLRARPSVAEARLGFAGLRDLLDDVAGEVLDEVPRPQADALRIALLLERPEGTHVDQSVVAASCVSVLRRLSAVHPVVLGVDDVQWLDAPTAAVLAFAWRRMRGHAVGLLVARRTGEPVPAGLDGSEGLTRLEVGPLGVDAVRGLLARRLGLVFPVPTLRRLHAVAGGNPFFALELGPAFDRHRADIAAGGPAPVPERLLDLVAQPIAALPAATREALAAVSALARPTVALVAAAVGDAQSLRPAFAARVIEADGRRVRFSHPLLAAAATSRSTRSRGGRCTAAWRRSSLTRTRPRIIWRWRPMSRTGWLRTRCSTRRIVPSAEGRPRSRPSSTIRRCGSHR